jgi:hypothetical protein
MRLHFSHDFRILVSFSGERRKLSDMSKKWRTVDNLKFLHANLGILN